VIGQHPLFSPELVNIKRGLVGNSGRNIAFGFVGDRQRNFIDEVLSRSFSYLFLPSTPP
jgi:hypothetical protein